MAVFDTHRAVKALKSAGFPDQQAKALVDVVGEEREALATKDGLEALGSRMNARFDALDNAVSECATKAELREMELRMRPDLGANVFAAAGLVITVTIGLELLR